MKKFMNTSETMLAESLSGFAQAHADIIEMGPDRRFVRRRTLKQGKPALISGGGSGHEPMHLGFVGHGMIDAACPGQIFTSPTPDQMLTAAASVDTGAGCLFIVKNYEGDLMNFELATEMAPGRVDRLVIDDDTAVEADDRGIGRRGIAGTLIVEKLLGAAAERGANLPQLKQLGTSVNAVTRSMGVALNSCTIPASGRPNLILADDEMEVGVGIHGEPGRRRAKLVSAQAITDELLDTILRDLAPRSGAELLLLINGLGATPLMELYLMADCAAKRLRDAGLSISRYLVGNYVTSLDMRGCSLTVTLLNDELRTLWDAPVHTPALRWGL